MSKPMENQIVEFNELKSEVSVMVAPTMAMTVSNAMTANAAINAAKAVKDYQKKIETVRKSLVDPLNAQVKKINSYAKEIELPLLEAETHLKRQLALFEEEQEKIRLEALKKAEEERRRIAEELAKKQAEELEVATMFGESAEEVEAKHTAEQAALYNAVSTQVAAIESKGVKNSTKIWKCKAIDLAQVPKEFLIIQLNEKAVIAAAKAGVKIPGVELWQETSIRIGSNTRAG